MNEAEEITPLTIEQTIQQRIMDGLDAMDVSYGEEAIANLVEYLDLLQEWNKTHNLTAVDDVDQMLSIHIFDSVSIKPYMKGPTLLDVGSGAGLPGMIWAILSPALEVVSIEAKGKKAQFQKFVANKLQLKNFTVENVRVEEYDPAEKFSMVTARAFSSLTEFVELSKNAIASNGRWLAMKGVMPEEELKELSKVKNIKFDTYALKVPELDAQRNLVVIEPKNSKK